MARPRMKVQRMRQSKGEVDLDQVPETNNDPNQTFPEYIPIPEDTNHPNWGEVTTKGIILNGKTVPKVIVPPFDVYRLAVIGCSDKEIADWFGVNEDTLRYNFNEYMIKARSQVKHRLRNAQIKLALEGNATMLIWLGKNMLGQKENPVDTEENKPLPWNDE